MKQSKVDQDIVDAVMKVDQVLNSSNATRQAIGLKLAPLTAEHPDLNEQLMQAMVPTPSGVLIELDYFAVLLQQMKDRGLDVSGSLKPLLKQMESLAPFPPDIP